MTKLYEEREEELFNPSMTDLALANLARTRLDQYKRYREELRGRGYITVAKYGEVSFEKTETKKTVL